MVPCIISVYVHSYITKNNTSMYMYMNSEYHIYRYKALTKLHISDMSFRIYFFAKNEINLHSKLTHGNWL